MVVTVAIGIITLLAQPPAQQQVSKQAKRKNMLVILYTVYRAIVQQTHTTIGKNVPIMEP